VKRIAIIGAGVIGAAIAWELSAVPDWEIHLFEAESSPAQGATGAALGLLMAVLSERGTQKRLASLQRYHQMPTPISGNPRGILHLYDDPQDWQKALAQIPRRQHQGWTLHPLTPEQVITQFPQVDPTPLIGAIFAPQERQVQPLALTQNWLNLAQQQGVQIHYHSPVLRVIPGKPIELELPDQEHQCDWLIISAGLGSTQLAGLTAPFQLEPVLGQAIEVFCPELQTYPILYGKDTAIVPQTGGAVWVGATVEFSPSRPPQPDPVLLEQLWQKATYLCPLLQEKPWQRQWHGLRPRPVGQTAPILHIDPQCQRILWATGHYRNGVLLAPFTADWVRQTIQSATP
jgi:glycine/D-amino acid oxidase-like deaminating enzyme